MTIVMIGQKGLPTRSGGIERHVQNLAEGLVKHGHRVVVFGRRWYVRDGVAPIGVEQVFTRGIHTKHLDALTHSFTALIAARRYSPDIVHLHGVGIGLLAPIARLLHPRAKIVVTFHCLDRVFSKWGLIARLAFRIGEVFSCVFAHRTITVSQYLLKYCLETYGCQTNYITHAFRLPELHSVTNAKQLADYGLNEGKYILFVSRLLPHKGAHLLVRAYERACKQFPELFRDIKLVIVGGGSWTDEYVLNLTRYAESVPGVSLLGEVFGDNLRMLQTRALCHAFPTWEEGLSLAVLEAGASGRPVIATDLPPNVEALGTEAMYVHAKDVAGLTQAIIQMVSTPENSRVLAAQKTRQHIARQFDYNRGIEQVECLYKELCVQPTSLIEINAAVTR